jgi:hypothetical protein
MTCCLLEAFNKNKGNGTKQDKLQPEDKLLEQTLHKLLARGASYYITHYMSQDKQLEGH